MTTSRAIAYEIIKGDDSGETRYQHLNRVTATTAQDGTCTGWKTQKERCACYVHRFIWLCRLKYF